MRLRTVTGGLLLILATLVLPQPPSYAEDGCDEERGICGSAGTDDFDIIATDPKPGTPGGTGSRGSSNGSGSGYTGPPTETAYAPTCTGNSAYDQGVLCNAALETCPVEGEVRFWKWQRVFDEGEWSGWRLVDVVCLGPDEPGIDPAVAIPAIVERDFERVVVVRGEAEVSPKPETLVNVATRFRTDAPASYVIPLSILGQSVVITAKAEKYTWHFGDGHSKTSYEPAGFVEHTYSQAAPRQAYVVITWSGSFTVNGGASQAIAGTVTTQGVPAEVVVREARTELVRD